MQLKYNLYRILKANDVSILGGELGGKVVRNKSFLPNYKKSAIFLIDFKNMAVCLQVVQSKKHFPAAYIM